MCRKGCSGPAMTDLLGGRVDMSSRTRRSGGRFVSGARCAPSGSPRRDVGSLPDIPTVAERRSRLRRWRAGTGRVPAGTHRTRREAERHRHRPPHGSVPRKRVEEGLGIAAGSPPELDEYVRSEEARWRKVVRRANMATAD